MSIELQGMSPLLSVFDMPTSLKFYRNVLGFEVVQDSGQGDDSGWVMLRKNDATLMLNTAYDDDERPPEPDKLDLIIHADTCIYFGCPDVDGAFHYLVKQGITLEPPAVAPYGMKQLYFDDPDGYALCFQWPAEK